MTRKDLLGLHGIKELTRQPLCGVYFLLAGDEIVYIGQSRNIEARVASHKSVLKYIAPFDTVLYVECERKELNKLESQYMQKYSPTLNTKHKQLTQEYV